MLQGPRGRFARLDPGSGELVFFDAEAVSPDGSAILTSDWTVRDLLGNPLLALPDRPDALADRMETESAPYSVDSWR